MNSITFINAYFGRGDFGKFDDSANLYNISQIRRRLPITNSPDEAMDYIGKYVPTLVQNRRFILYTDKFVTGIVYFIKEYEKDTRGLARTVPKQINGLFDEESDFIQRENVALFIRESDMKAWLFSLASLGFKNVSIKNKLDISFGHFNEPYIYSSPAPEEHFYIIQNVVDGNMMRALNVALNWYITKINQGYNTLPYDNLEDPHQLPVLAIYGISTASTLIAINDRTNDEEKFLQILTYGSNQYAAMLPII